MTTNDQAARFVIATPMSTDPELAFFTWKVNVEGVAAGEGTLVQPTGLLSILLSDEDWNKYETNRRTSPGGTVIVAPRPTPSTHVPIVAGMTSNAVAVAKYVNELHQQWHDASRISNQQSVIQGLGLTLAVTIGLPPNGFKMIPVRTIMTAVCAKYGVLLRPSDVGQTRRPAR
jgi:hypothetical protein